MLAIRACSFRLLLVAYLTVFSCVPSLADAQCSFTDDSGNTFDFSALTRSGSNNDYIAVENTKKYKYSFNVCGVSTTTVTECKGSLGSGNVCQLKMDNTFTAVCGYWANPIPTFALINPQDPSQGVSLTSKNGDACWPSSTPRTTTINFVCDPNVVGQLNASEITCEYTINFPTSYACVSGGGGGDNKLGGGDNNLSGGWVFVIVVLCLIPVYIVAGCLWNHRKHGDTVSWMQKCPNHDFWFALPGLCWDGCKFTWRGIRSLIGRCTSGAASDGGNMSSEGYDNFK